MTALSSDPKMVVVPEWRLPTTSPEFVAWLRAIKVPGESDRDRVKTFLDRYTVAQYMPDELRQTLKTTFSV